MFAFDFIPVSLDDSIIDIIKLSATNGIEYLLVKEGNTPLGIIQLKSLLKNIDKLSQISLKDYMNSDFIIINDEELSKNFFKHFENRYILILRNNEYTGIIDLFLNQSNAKHLLDSNFCTFDSIINYSNNGIIVIDIEKKVIVLNEIAAEIYGVQGKNAIDKPINDIIPESPLSSFSLEFSKQFTYEHVINNRFIQSTCSQLTVYGRIVGAICIIQDYTQLKRSNEQILKLKNNEEYLESIIDNSYDGIYITDKYGLTLNINKAWERITGIKKDYLIGKYMVDLVKDGLLSVTVTDDVVKNKKPVTVNQIIRNGKSVVITGSPIFDNSGDVIYVITNVRDRTELIDLEKKLMILNQTSELYQKELFKDIASEHIICQSNIFTNTLKLAKKVSTKDSSVLILGETGSGKEVIAKFIHSNSNRSNAPYIKLNCGAIPANLLESELFGYTAGAFTGANPKGKIGMFELADEGTLFLDEIGEMPIDLQSSLLRVLQDGEVIRIGDFKSHKVNVRIIAATNRNLEEMIANGTFRSDLFYRLNVVSIHVPSLKERLDDIPMLAEHFINLLNKKYNENKIITNNFINELIKLKWPGNIRELSNFIEKQFVMSDDNIIDYFITIYTPTESVNNNISNSVPQVIVKGIIPLNEAVKEVESILIGRAMEKGSTTYKAAKLLNISQPTFFRKYKEYYKVDILEGDKNDK